MVASVCCFQDHAKLTDSCPGIGIGKENVQQIILGSACLRTQLSPPSVVLRIMPAPPTTVPVLASVKKTPTIGLKVPLDWLVQVFPPSVVRRIVPCNPQPSHYSRRQTTRPRDHSLFACLREPSCSLHRLFSGLYQKNQQSSRYSHL